MHIACEATQQCGIIIYIAGERKLLYIIYCQLFLAVTEKIILLLYPTFISVIQGGSIINIIFI